MSKRSTNNTEVKRLNRNRVFRYINNRDETSMPEISSALDISTPTVLTIVNELKEEGIVEEVGELKSTGGRKAKVIATIKDNKYAIGIDITKNHIGIIHTDLSRQVLKYERVGKPFENTRKYFFELNTFVSNYISENDIPKERLIGIGISVPGIVDQERKIITKSHALDVYHVACGDWEEHLSWPCEFLNDANAAALAERIRCGDRSSMVYLSLSNTVGGAIMFRSGDAADEPEGVSDAGVGSLYVGDEWRSAEFGHMVIHPGGERCYCGKKGCLDAYCSALKLADMENGKLERFFEQMEAGNKVYKQMWKRYLEDLAVAVDNLRMCFDCEVVLGGYVGSCMEPYIPEFRKLIAGKNIFSDNGGFVRACKYQKEASALGAAIYQIESYISMI